MPYKSDAQRRYFHANEDTLRAQGVDIDEWDESSRGMELPERVESDDNEDEEKEASLFNSMRFQYDVLGSMYSPTLFAQLGKSAAVMSKIAGVMQGVYNGMDSEANSNNGCEINPKHPHYPTLPISYAEKNAIVAPTTNPAQTQQALAQLESMGKRHVPQNSPTSWTGPLNQNQGSPPNLVKALGPPIASGSFGLGPGTSVSPFNGTPAPVEVSQKIAAAGQSCSQDQNWLEKLSAKLSDVVAEVPFPTWPTVTPIEKPWWKFWGENYTETPGPSISYEDAKKKFAEAFQSAGYVKGVNDGFGNIMLLPKGADPNDPGAWHFWDHEAMGAIRPATLTEKEMPFLLSDLEDPHAYEFGGPNPAEAIEKQSCSQDQNWLEKLANTAGGMVGALGGGTLGGALGMLGGRFLPIALTPFLEKDYYGNVDGQSSELIGNIGAMLGGLGGAGIGAMGGYRVGKEGQPWDDIAKNKKKLPESESSPLLAALKVGLPSAAAGGLMGGAGAVAGAVSHDDIAYGVPFWGGLGALGAGGLGALYAYLNQQAKNDRIKTKRQHAEWEKESCSQNQNWLEKLAVDTEKKSQWRDGQEEWNASRDIDDYVRPRSGGIPVSDTLVRRLMFGMYPESFQRDMDKMKYIWQSSKALGNYLFPGKSTGNKPAKPAAVSPIKAVGAPPAVKQSCSQDQNWLEKLAQDPEFDEFNKVMGELLAEDHRRYVEAIHPSHSAAPDWWKHYVQDQANEQMYSAAGESYKKNTAQRGAYNDFLQRLYDLKKNDWDTRSKRPIPLSYRYDKDTEGWVVDHAPGKIPVQAEVPEIIATVPSWSKRPLRYRSSLPPGPMTEAQQLKLMRLAHAAPADFTDVFARKYGGRTPEQEQAYRFYGRDWDNAQKAVNYAGTANLIGSGITSGLSIPTANAFAQRVLQASQTSVPGLDPMDVPVQYLDKEIQHGALRPLFNNKALPQEMRHKPISAGSGFGSQQSARRGITEKQSCSQDQNWLERLSRLSN